MTNFDEELEKLQKQLFDDPTIKEYFQIKAEIANNKSISILQNDIITYAKEMTRNVNNDDKYFENKNKYEESLKLYNSNPLVINLHEISKSVENILLELKKILE